MTKCTKILAFDLNYKANYRFVSLYKTFKDNNYELFLICDDPAFKKNNENINGLLIKNISSYSSKNYLSILNYETPSLVIVLGINNLKIRALNRCCKFLDIPIMLLEHGVTSASGLTNSKRFNSKKFILKRFKRIIKGELIKDYFFYIRYLFLTNSSLKDWILFFIESLAKLIGKDLPSKDWNYSAYCVFLDSDKLQIINQLKNKIDKSKVHVVGNYDLNLFDIATENFNSYNNNNSSKSVLYIDSDCVFRTFDGKLKLYFAYISKIKRILNKSGYKLKIKLHPNAINRGLNQKLSNYHIKTIFDKDFISELMNSKFVISEPSSLTSLVGLTGIPILTPIIKPFDKKRYGQIFDEYPNRKNFSSYAELEYFLNQKKIYSNKTKVNNWIKKYAGPLPPLEFPLRVIKVIKNII